jgi:hypothetical protein
LYGVLENDGFEGFKNDEFMEKIKMINTRFSDELSLLDKEDEDSFDLTRTKNSTVNPMEAEAEKQRLQQQRKDEEEEAKISETKNSKIWLPFSIPKNLGEREEGVERVYVPLISIEMMSLLDTHSSKEEETD